MNGFDVAQVVLLGLGTGFGSALGMELGKYIVSILLKKRGG